MIFTSLFHVILFLLVIKEKGEKSQFFIRFEWFGIVLSQQ